MAHYYRMQSIISQTFGGQNTTQILIEANSIMDAFILALVLLVVSIAGMA